MGLYKKWCDATKEERSHYDRLERIAEDVKRLGYEVAAKILSEAMPQTPKGRSGDLGEILATELVEEEIGLRVPVRRLRYKDGRNMAMRGDDFIGAGYDAARKKLWLLKVKPRATRSSARPRSKAPARCSTATMAAAARFPAVRRQPPAGEQRPGR